MLLFAQLAAAQTVTLRVPFPTSRLFPDKQDRVCLVLGDRDLGVDAIETEAGAFRASCEVMDGKTRACLTLLRDSWPERIAPLHCDGDAGSLKLVPVPAFDPADTLEDGVRIARSVHVVQAAFRTELPDAVGVLQQGACSVEHGLLRIETRHEPRRQHCLLVHRDGTERTIPITLVNRL